MHRNQRISQLQPDGFELRTELGLGRRCRGPAGTRAGRVTETGAVRAAAFPHNVKLPTECAELRVQIIDLGASFGLHGSEQFFFFFLVLLIVKHDHNLMRKPDSRTREYSKINNIKRHMKPVGSKGDQIYDKK
jgi:hypothetical protein